MKKIISTLLIATLIFSLNISAFANDAITVKLNGSEISFDVAPQIMNGRTMVPLRAIFESLGASVEWNGETQTVSSTKDNITITLTIDSNSMLVNGEIVMLDSPACIVNGRTLVPVRAISEAFKTNVEWDGETKTVLITSFENLKIGIYDGAIMYIDTMPAEANTSVQLAVSHNDLVDLEYNKFFNWESSDVSIAEVENGLVNAYNTSGLVTIKAIHPDGIVLEQRINVYNSKTGTDSDTLYNKILDEFEFNIGDDGGSAWYKGKLNREDFVKEFEYGDSSWRQATMRIMEEYVEKNKYFSGLMFYYQKNGKGNQIFLGNILYDCNNTQWNDGYSKWWESSKKIADENYK